MCKLLFSLVTIFFVSISFSHQTVYFFLEAYDDVFAQSARDNLHTPFIQLKQSLAQMDYRVKSIREQEFLDLQLDSTDFLICFDLPGYSCYTSRPPEKKYIDKLKVFPRNQMILFLSEPPTVKACTYDLCYHSFFKRVYTLSDDLVDFKHYFKFFETVPIFYFHGEHSSFEKRKLAVLLSSKRHSTHPLELYSQRCAVINFFERVAPSQFDYYGNGWQKTRCYRGFAQSKINTFTSYKFCFCYENMRDFAGYITGEKIFYPMICGAIPVYWGPQNITEYIPSNCFVDRRQFGSDQALYEHLRSMSKERYDEYIRNIKIYLNSEQAQLFSTEYFVFTVLDALFDRDCIKNYYHACQLEKFKRLDALYRSIWVKNRTSKYTGAGLLPCFG